MGPRILIVASLLVMLSFAWMANAHPVALAGEFKGVVQLGVLN